MSSSYTPSSSAPHRDWSASGEYVLDHLFNTRTAEVVGVRWTGGLPPPDIALVRAALDVPPGMSVRASDSEFVSTFNVDGLRMWSDKTITDSSGEQVDVSSPLTSYPLELLGYELSALDALRGSRLMQGYPQLVVDRALRNRIEATVEHLDKIRGYDADLATMMLDNEPFTIWRV